MWKKLFLLVASAALLMFSGAEAMTGHCAAASVEKAEITSTSDHCEHMNMKSAPPVDDDFTQDEPAQSDSGACCCVIASAPILLSIPYFDPPARAVSVWARSANARGPDAATNVNLPPPRG